MNTIKIKADNNIKALEAARATYGNQYVVANLGTCKAVAISDGAIEEVCYEDAKPVENKSTAMDIAICLNNGYMVFESYRFFSMLIDSYKALKVASDFEF